MLPTSKYTVINNTDMQVSLCWYLGEEIPFLPKNCNCKPPAGRAFVEADSFGNHSLSCKKDGFPIKRHDAVRDTLHAMFTHAGIHTTAEDKKFFASVFPEDKTRADLYARGAGNGGKDLLMDFVCSHPGSQSFMRHCKTTVSAGAIFPFKNAAKNKKYKAKAEENYDVTFMPMAFDVYGSWSEAFHRVFKKLALFVAEVHDIPVASVMSYWTARISHAIYMVHAQCFRYKISNLSAKVNGCNDPQLAPQILVAAMNVL